MRVHAASASAAVRRTLEALIVAHGHQVADPATAEMILHDAVHPKAHGNATCPVIALTTSDAEAGLRVPVRLSMLTHALRARIQTTTLALGGGWNLDLNARLITGTAESISLTEKEADLLAAILEAAPAATGREELLNKVWGMRQEIDTHTLETHIYRLRNKLGSLAPLPCDIVTEDGAYKIVGIDR